MKKDPQITLVLGAQWGDEGKGKIVDILAEKSEIIVRATGGANAGHTLVVGGKKYVFHLIPSGILHHHTICLIGNGCTVHLPTLLDEIHLLREAGIPLRNRLFLSDRAHLVFDYHLHADQAEEQKRAEKIGTTRRGIGPAYADKVRRQGIRAGLLRDRFSLFSEIFIRNAKDHQQQSGFLENFSDQISLYEDMAEEFSEMILDTQYFLHQARESGKKIIIEGAQGVMLDIDFGTYPFVTSSNTTAAGAASGSGLPPRAFDMILGVLKAYTTRVGGGPFPSEISGAAGDRLREKGSEYGATTGRPRRIGHFDAVAARYSAQLNGIDFWNLTKLDILSGEPELRILTGYHLQGKRLPSFPSDTLLLQEIEPEYAIFPGWTEDLSSCRQFSDLPLAAQAYCRAIVRETGVPLHSVGVGPGRDDLLWCRAGDGS